MEILYYLELAIHESDLNEMERIKPLRVGPTIDVILKETFPIDILTENKRNEVISRFRSYYDNSDFFLTRPFNYIDSIISDTDNFVHHIVTNKPDTTTRHIIEKLGWTEKITSVETPYSYSSNNSSVLEHTKRQKSELFADVIRKYGEKPSSFIGIGDMRSDCVAARDNNITAVGVLWGSGIREELLDCCDYLFEDTKQLRDFLYEK